MARVMQGTATEVTSDVFKLPVIGTLDAELNLKIDGFAKNIPKEDYHVWQPRINLYTRPVSTMDDGSYSVLSQDYRVELYLKVDDRVICVPIEDGHTYMITGHVKGGLAE